jgi:hypothetical protein
MSKQKHHIIPRYICKVLWPDIFNGLVPGYKIDGKEFYFKENVVWVERLDHARIHWGYFCDDLEPLFEYVTPAQWIIDLIPRGDNRDMWAAQLLAEGEIDGIDMSGENHPRWKGGISYDMKAYYASPEYKAYQKKRRSTPEHKAYQKAYMKAYDATPEYKAYQKAYMKAYRQTPEHKEYMKAYNKKRRSTPEYKESVNKRQSTPEHRAYKKAWYAKKKAKAQS